MSLRQGPIEKSRCSTVFDGKRMGFVALRARFNGLKQNLLCNVSCRPWKAIAA